MEGKNTKDYVKLAAPMKLPEFAVDFPYYPWLSAIKPFERWVHTDSPSQGLGWYAAYNNVKHDRESKFAEATLHCAFQAISGCFVMLCAQYGWDFALRGGGASRAFLRLVTAPQWEPAEVYVPPHHGELIAKRYPFSL